MNKDTKAGCGTSSSLRQAGWASGAGILQRCMGSAYPVGDSWQADRQAGRQNPTWRGAQLEYVVTACCLIGLAWLKHQHH